MELIFPINFLGHDAWMQSGYDLNLAGGDVITRDGEIVGQWRVVGYDPEAEDEDDEGGRYEFIPVGRDEVSITEDFAYLDYRMSRGLALSQITRAIRDWYEAENPDFPLVKRSPFPDC